MKFRLKNKIYESLIVIVIISFGTLIIRKNEPLKGNLYNIIYNTNISFSKIKSIYNQKIGSVIPFENVIKTKEVFNEDLKYKEISKYDNGVKLTLASNYSIPILSNGIVVFIGNRDNLNKTVIIEDENGINYYYGNLDNVNVKLYDYVSKNDLLGNAQNNELYLLFNKDGKYLDYKEFLK